ncbi:hypothetical protein N9145_03700 [bacterium]|nr:hypothetical protein [bacterium]
MSGLLYTPSNCGSGMATAKTGSFYLTETVTLPGGSVSGVRVQGTIDLGAYVNVATGQAIAIDQVDFVTQSGDTFSMSINQFLTGNGGLGFQLTDLNPGTAFVRADNQSLIASGGLAIDDANNIATHNSDLYPDNYGSAGTLSEMFMVVNDTLYLTAGVDGASVSAQDLSITARIRARVVKLGSKDWMALALQSTASDN